jgi:hypothetical protein
LLGTIYRILPHFEVFDVREAILTDVPVVWYPYMASTMGMAVVYVGIVLALGYLFFSQREV